MIILIFLLSFYNVQRPCIVYIDTPNKAYDKIPLTDIKVDVEVSGTAVQSNYTLTYKNTDNNTLVEAKLKFPFDIDVAVSDVSLHYKNQTIIGQIMKNSDAKTIYNNEKQDKNIAMLVQRVGDYISIDLAGIEPNETFTAKISSYNVLDLKFEHKKENFFTRYAFPTSMVPRYSPKNSEKSYENPYLLTNVSYTFEFNLKTTTGQISSESVLKMKEKSKGKIEWNDKTFSYSGEVPNDVVIDIITKNPDSLVEMTIENFENSTVTEISIPGPLLLNLRKSEVQKKSDIEKKKSYVFLIDRSGSMFNEPIKNAKSALELFLHSMPPDSIFEIVGFGSNYNPLFGELVEYNDSTLEKAINYAKSLEADMGGTEMLGPLQYILPQSPDHLIFLTDGAVSNVNEVKSYCSRFSTQISTIAIGNYASKDLLKTISMQSLGTYELVNDMSQIEGAVIRSLSAMRNGFSVTSIKSNCGVLFQALPVLLLPETAIPFRFFNANGHLKEKVVVEITVEDFATKNEFNLTISQDDNRVVVDEINGKKLHCNSLLKAMNENVIDDNVAFNLSLKLGLMTKLTSFILVDKRSPLEKVKYQSKTVEIPVKAQNPEFLHSISAFSAFDGGSNIPHISYSAGSAPTVERMPKMKNFMRRSKSSFFGKAKTNRIMSYEYAADDEDENDDDYQVDVDNNNNDNDCKSKCNNILSLQKSNGKWNLTEILNALQIKLDKNDEKEWLNNKDERENLLAGLFAIEYLKNNCSDLYKLVIEKGYSFINSKFSKQLIESASDVVTIYKLNK